MIAAIKNAAYPKAIAELKAAGILSEGVELRQVKYLNNLIEQDHRFIKRLALGNYVALSKSAAIEQEGPLLSQRRLSSGRDANVVE